MALPTLDDVKLHLRVDSTTEDPLITSLLAGAIDHFEQSTRRVLSSRSIVERLDSLPDSRVIFLEKGPVTSVTSVTVRTLTGVSTISASDYITITGQTETKPLIAFKDTANLPTPDNYPGAVTVIYVSETTTIPESINAAIRLLVAHWYENRQAVGPTGGNEVPLAYQSVASKYMWGAYG
jgi:uncharacterized phiE125 gp8 family phage protein